MQNLNPFCKGISEIDFSKPTDLCKVLHQDKHTRIEGLCSEAVFMEDIIQGNIEPVTTGFWFSETPKNPLKFHIWKIITDISIPINSLDYRILDGFASIKGMPVSIVYFDETSKSFLEFMHKKGNRYSNIKDLGTKKYPNSNSLVANERQRNEVRIEKACRFLDHRGLLKNAAIGRLFANCWLKGAVWDIDTFTITPSGKVIAFEVKQKYPTDNSTFGINAGQERLFQFLLEKGMPVIHVILQKPERDKAISAIDLLTMPEYVNRTNWIFTRYFPEILSIEALSAPEYTSIFGQSEVPYKEIPTEQFAFLKKLGKPSEDVRAKLLKGLV